MPLLEHRKWFQLTTAFAGFVITLACALTIYTALPNITDSAKFALIVLFGGAQLGIAKILETLLPLLLLKIWPSLETDRLS